MAKGQLQQSVALNTYPGSLLHCLSHEKSWHVILRSYLNLINCPIIEITIDYDTPFDLLLPIFTLIYPSFTSSPHGSPAI